MTMEALTPQQRQQRAAQQRRPIRPVGAPLLEGAHRLIRVPSPGTMQPETTSQTTRVVWPQSGRVLAVRAFALDPQGDIAVDTASGLVSAAILIDGETALFSNGESGDFIPLLAFSPGAAPWFQIEVPVIANRPWQITFRNLSVDFPLRPELVFAFRRGQLAYGTALHRDAARAVLGLAQVAKHRRALFAL